MNKLIPMTRVCDRLLVVAVSLSLWTSAQGESLSTGGDGQATIPLVEERAYLDRDVLAGDRLSGESPLALDRPGAATNEPGLTPAQAEQLSETFLAETGIGSLVLFGLIYRLLIK